nr:MAG TPA: hypothetical protein [Caudoviricetes sp.]
MSCPFLLFLHILDTKLMKAITIHIISVDNLLIICE